MPRAGKRQLMADGEHDVDDRGSLDPVTRRRMRNRLSQRQFRERRSMYIKELEERSKSSVQSESDRNKALIEETLELRRELLQLRSKVLKLSVSLNAIGSEAGKVLDKEVSERLQDEGENIDSSLGGAETEQVAAYSATLDLQQLQGLAGVTGGDQSNERSRSPIHGEPVDKIPEVQISEQPVMDLNASQRLTENSDPRNGNTTICSHVEQIVGQGDRITAIPEQHDHMDYLIHVPESPPEDLSSGEPSVNATQLCANDGLHEPQFDLDPPENTAFTDRSPVTYLNPEEWMVRMFGSVQGSLSGYNLENDSSESLVAVQQDTNTRRGLIERSSTLIPPRLSQSGLSLPPGLAPAAESQGSCAPFQMHSRLSEHIEALEKFIRCRLYAASDQISRQRLYQCFSGMIGLLTKHAWPSTHPVWFKSQVPEIILPIMLWRLHPTTESHKYLPLSYRPTTLQLTVPHSPIIDWVSYPSLRDRMILCYNGNVALDRMMCEYLNSHVVEVDDVSQILPHAPPERGYFGVWNVYKGIYTDRLDDPDQTFLPLGTGLSEAEPSTLDFDTQEHFRNIIDNASLQDWNPSRYWPNSSSTHKQGFKTSGPQSVVELLSTPELALRLSHDLRLYEAKSWRVDKSFFKAYPELKFDGYETITAQGKSYRMFTEPPNTPIPMTEKTFNIYFDEIAKIA